MKVLSDEQIWSIVFPNDEPTNLDRWAKHSRLHHTHRDAAYAQLDQDKKDVIDWGNEVCPHMSRTYKWECQHCTREFREAIKAALEVEG